MFGQDVFLGDVCKSVVFDPFAQDEEVPQLVTVVFFSGHVAVDSVQDGLFPEDASGFQSVDSLEEWFSEGLAQPGGNGYAKSFLFSGEDVLG